MKKIYLFEDKELDEDIATDDLRDVRDELISRGYQCYYNEEDCEHEWINRPLTNKEKKYLKLMSKKDLNDFRRSSCA